jgi:outer membrane autotransporter protein
LQGDARGRTDGEEVDLLFGTGYFWKSHKFTFGPTATFQYTDVGLNGFTEKGSLAPLQFGSQSAESIRSTLGFKVSFDWKLGDAIVRPELSAAWKHEYGPRSFAIDSRLASGAGSLFTVNDGEIGRDSLLLSGGVSVLWNARTSTYLYYDGELARKEYDSQNVSGGVRFSF